MTNPVATESVKPPNVMGVLPAPITVPPKGTEEAPMVPLVGASSCLRASVSVGASGR
jgi:hypothetical protein